MADISVSEGESSVSASVGDRILTRLEEPGATGYQWTAEVTGDAVLLDRDSRDSTETPRDAAPEISPGQAVAHLVEFLAVAVGSAEVCLELRRPWEHEALRRVVFRVTVE
jgi:predicted secreted protein